MRLYLLAVSPSLIVVWCHPVQLLMVLLVVPLRLGIIPILLMEIMLIDQVLLLVLIEIMILIMH